MNRGEIKTAIKDTMQLDPGLISNRERERFIQDVLNELSALGVWESTVEQTVSAFPVTLPATFSSFVEAYWNGQRLQKIDRRELGGAIPTGIPLYCWVESDKLYVWPVPASEGTLKVIFISKAADIPPDEAGTGADLTDLSELGVPVEWHHIIVDGAVAKAHRKNGNYLAAQEYARIYNTDKNTLYVAALEKLNSRITKNEPDDTITYPVDVFIPPRY